MDVLILFLKGVPRNRIALFAGQPGLSDNAPHRFTVSFVTQDRLDIVQPFAITVFHRSTVGVRMSLRTEIMSH